MTSVINAIKYFPTPTNIFSRYKIFSHVQVEAREDVSLQGVPAAVVQYNTWKGGGIIAVNYEAR